MSSVRFLASLAKRAAVAFAVLLVLFLCSALVGALTHGKVL